MAGSIANCRPVDMETRPLVQYYTANRLYTLTYIVNSATKSPNYINRIWILFIQFIHCVIWSGLDYAMKCYEIPLTIRMLTDVERGDVKMVRSYVDWVE